MAKIPLTDLGIQKLTPGTYFDARTPAFGIGVGKNRRTWIATKGKDQRVVTLGHYPAVSLTDARKRAYGVFLAPAEAAARITFPEAKEAFLAQEKWRYDSRRVLTSSLKHFTWTCRLTKISHVDVLVALDAVEGRSARAHALKDICSFFNWCIPRYLSASPAAGIRMEKQQSRDRVLTDDELRRVWVAAGELGQFGAIARLLILTGQRRSEIGSLHHSMVEDDRLCFPPSVTKKGREHVLPLAENAQSLLPPRGNGFVFPNENGDSFTSWSKNHAALLKLSETSGWTLQDLRRTLLQGSLSSAPTTSPAHWPG